MSAQEEEAFSKTLKRYRTKKDVVVYHPHYLVAEAGSIFRTGKGILFGIFGSTIILNESSPEFKEYFEELPKP